MAFRFKTSFPEIEYRGEQSGASERGRWLSLIFEDSECNQLSVSVPKDMQSDVYALCLRKGDMCAIAVRAVATADGNSYIQLLAVPEVLEDED